MSNWIYKIWIGDEITIPIGLSIFLGIFVIIDLIITPYVFFINGMGKLKLTIISKFLEIVIYLILIYVFGNIFANSTGIVLAIIFATIISGIIQPVQTYKLLNRDAKGIWNK
jgi:O-antigen/teichoic acid export membrane protein